MLRGSLAVAPPPLHPPHLRRVPRASSRQCVHDHGAVRDDVGGVVVAEVPSVAGGREWACGG